jgi:biotin carboxyl carrier protein
MGAFADVAGGSVLGGGVASSVADEGAGVAGGACAAGEPPQAPAERADTSNAATAIRAVFGAGTRTRRQSTPSARTAVRYHVLLGADPTLEYVVDLVELPDGALEARTDGVPVKLDVVSIGNALSVRVGPQIIDLTMHGALPETDASLSGYRSRVRVESDRLRSAVRLGTAAEAQGEKVVRSPMPGRVVKVLVAEGDTVRPGQGLLVLEAMKMENEVRARAAGTVVKVHVTAGAAVEGSAVLVTLG